MNETEIAVKLEAHEHEIASLKHRMDDAENEVKSINDLVLSVQKLAINMESMIKEQAKQSDRLQKLESAPAEAWSTAKKTAFTSIVSCIGGALAVGIIYAIAKGMGIL